jgi:membrane protease YdiL (CAAX protease family)
MKAVFIAFSLYYLLFEPIFGYFFFKRFTRRLAADPGEKLRYYKKTLLYSWLPAGIITVITVFGQYPAADIGIGWIKMNDGIFGKWGTYGILIAFCLLFLLYIYQVIMAKASTAYRDKLAAIKLPPEVGILLPRTDVEKKYWILISTSAGLIEELVYRGFLIFLLSNLFPGLHIYLYILISSLLFGMAHTYQGPAGILKTGLAGLLFSLVYVCTGSLLPGILLHFIMDYSAQNIGTDKDVQAAG